MRARLLAFAIPLALVACKKKEAPAPASSVALAAPSAAVTAAPGQGLAILKDFEGQIAWVASGKLARSPQNTSGAPLTVTLQLKGDKFRLDLPPGMPGAPPGSSAYMLGSKNEKKLYVILDAQKQAILIDAEKMEAQLSAMGGSGAAPGAGAGSPSLKKTGKADKVAGYSCEIWEVTDPTSKTELCIAAESTAWFKLPIAKLPEQYAWAAELTDGKHFPLRVITFDKGGAEAGRIELSRIDKKTLDAKTFEIPAGYQTVDLEAMMASMMQRFGGVRGRPGAPAIQGLPGPVPNLQGLPIAPKSAPSGTAPKPAPASQKKDK